jgi:hypothetical protein
MPNAYACDMRLCWLAAGWHFCELIFQFFIFAVYLPPTLTVVCGGMIYF